MPSLSVVHTVPSRRKKVAPALSSPPKPSEPSSRPSTNHLKPTGTSTNRRPRWAATRSIRLLLTRVLPTAAVLGHCGRLAKRYAMATARYWFGFSNPLAAGDDAVPVGVGVAGEGDVEAVFQTDQPLPWHKGRSGPCESARPNRRS